MLVAMGYRPTVRIRKRRCTTRLGDVTVCLDDVDGLGLFLEAEVMASESADAIAVQRDLRARVEAFELPIEWVEDGYDTLVAATLAADAPWKSR